MRDRNARVIVLKMQCEEIFPLNILVRERNWGVVDLSLLTAGIEVIFEHFMCEFT